MKKKLTAAGERAVRTSPSTAFVPRVVYQTVFAGVIPVCVALGSVDCGPQMGTADAGFSVADRAFHPTDATDVPVQREAGVADTGFSVADTGFSVADAGFSVADVGFRG